MKLYDSAFSPFARKVRMVLEHKGLPFEAVDGLLKSSHAALQAVNGRVEVPVLVDGDITVVNSADIVAYLEFRYPEKPVYPADPAARVHARAWERTADTLVDAMLVNISYWMLPERHDAMPAGLLDAARADLALVYAALERDLAAAISYAARCRSPTSRCSRTWRRGFMEVEFAKAAHPNLAALARRHAPAAHLRRRPAAGARFIGGIGARPGDERIFWRGDRIEWMLARGFHDWFFREIAEGRVLWPGPACRRHGEAAGGGEGSPFFTSPSSGEDGTPRA